MHSLLPGPSWIALASGTLLAVGTACSNNAESPGPIADVGDSAEVSDAEGGVEAATCVAPAVTCDGVCVVGSCDFSVTTMSPVATSSPGGAVDWVSGGAFFNVSGHGFAKGMRFFLGDGRAPVRVVDDTHATVEVPPSKAGAVDVRIELGAKIGKTPGGFTYRSAPLDGDSTWEKRSMSGPHSDVPAITVLADGRALISGGLTGFAPYTFSASADLFSLEAKDTIPAAGPMSTERWNHYSVSLLGGKAVILGAAGVNTLVPQCDNFAVDLFDPLTNLFTKTGAPVEGLAGPRAVLLVDGRVLVLDHQTTNAEIFDPDSGTFKIVKGAPTIDYWQFQGYQYLARLRDGRVLIATGQGRDAVLFDSDTETFSNAGKGPLAGPDRLLTLPDGRVAAVGGTIVVGGSTPPGDITKGGTSQATDRIELFDPSVAGGFVLAPFKLLKPRLVSAPVLQRDGTILVIGGATGSFPMAYACGSTALDERVTANVDQVDPVSGTVTAFAPLPEPNSYLVAATMRDGSAVAAGGGVCGTSAAYPYLYFRKAPKPVR
jgi:hypothetical protein